MGTRTFRRISRAVQIYIAIDKSFWSPLGCISSLFRFDIDQAERRDGGTRRSALDVYVRLEV